MFRPTRESSEAFEELLQMIEEEDHQERSVKERTPLLPELVSAYEHSLEKGMWWGTETEVRETTQFPIQPNALDHFLVGFYGDHYFFQSVEPDNFLFPHRGGSLRHIPALSRRETSLPAQRNSIEIVAPPDSEVQAPADGVIVWAEADFWGERASASLQRRTEDQRVATVYFQSDNGVLFTLSHLDPAILTTLNPGLRMEKGQTLGTLARLKLSKDKNVLIQPLRQVEWIKNGENPDYVISYLGIACSAVHDIENPLGRLTRARLQEIVRNRSRDMNPLLVLPSLVSPERLEHISSPPTRNAVLLHEQAVYQQYLEETKKRQESQGESENSTGRRSNSSRPPLRERRGRFGRRFYQDNDAGEGLISLFNSSREDVPGGEKLPDSVEEGLLAYSDKEIYHQFASVERDAFEMNFPIETSFVSLVKLYGQRSLFHYSKALRGSPLSKELISMRREKDRVGLDILALHDTPVVMPCEGRIVNVLQRFYSGKYHQAYISSESHTGSPRTNDHLYDIYIEPKNKPGSLIVIENVTPLTSVRELIGKSLEPGEHLGSVTEQVYSEEMLERVGIEIDEERKLPSWAAQGSDRQKRPDDINLSFIRLVYFPSIDYGAWRDIERGILTRQGLQTRYETTDPARILPDLKSDKNETGESVVTENVPEENWEIDRDTRNAFNSVDRYGLGGLGSVFPVSEASMRIVQLFGDHDVSQQTAEGYIPLSKELRVEAKAGQPLISPVHGEIMAILHRLKSEQDPQPVATEIQIRTYLQQGKYGLLIMEIPGAFEVNSSFNTKKVVMTRDELGTLPPNQASSTGEGSINFSLFLPTEEEWAVLQKEKQTKRLILEELTRAGAVEDPATILPRLSE